MEETIWTGKIDRRASNPDNWTNGTPNSGKRAVITEDFINYCKWDISDFTIPIRWEGSNIQIAIDDCCFFGGECYAPRDLLDYTLSIALDRPPPDIEIKGDGYIRVGNMRYTHGYMMKEFTPSHWNRLRNMFRNKRLVTVAISLALTSLIYLVTNNPSISFIGLLGMAGEFKHKDIGPELTRAEWEAIGGHEIDSQATGDVLYASSAIQISGLPIGTTEGQAMRVGSGGIPEWGSSLGLPSTLVVVANDAPAGTIGHYYCDGTADDVQINAALTALPTGAGEVILSVGTFDTIATLSVGYGAILNGSGMGQTIIDSSVAAEAIIYNDADAGQSTVRGGGISNLKVLGNSTATIGLRVKWAWSVVVERVDIRSCASHGMQIEATFGLDVNYCQILGNGGYGVNMVDYTGEHNTFVKFYGTDISNNDTYNFYNTSGTHLTLTSCWFENSGGNSAEHLFIDDTETTIPAVRAINCNFAFYSDADNGIDIDGGSLYLTQCSISCGATVTKTGITMSDGFLSVTNCNFASPGVAALDIDGGTLKAVNNFFIGYSGTIYSIDIAGGANHTVDDNYFTKGGVYSTASNSNINNNTFDDIIGDYVIWTSGTYVNIGNNNINDVDEHGIYSDGSYTTISRNMLNRIGTDTDNTYTGIHVNGARNRVINNTIYSNTVNKPQYGIYVESEFFCQVTNNIIEGCVTWDIYLTGGGSNLVTNNTVIDGLMSLPFSVGDIYRDNIGWDESLTADGQYLGELETGTAGAALAFGELCYLAVADSKWELTDANVEASAGPVKLGICVRAAAEDADTIMMLRGKVRADAAFPTLTVSAPVHVGTTPGDVQVAAPAGGGDVVRVIGYGNTANEVYFCPDNSYSTV